MAGRSLEEFEAEKTRLLGEIAQVGDCRQGSVSENYRKCGKPNCACADPEHPGHGPLYLWTRSLLGRRTKGRQIAAGEMEKVRGEIANYHWLTELMDELLTVSDPRVRCRSHCRRPRQRPKMGALRPGDR